MTMRTARGLDGLERSNEPIFVVVGVFDGLHRGHAYLLERLVAEARRRNARPVVITFDHHPDEILTGSAPPLLCDPDERLALLEEAGVAATIVVHFDQRLRETTYDDFVAQVAERAPIAGFLMTPDAAFGYQRGGTPETLAALGAERGFEVVVVPPFEIDGPVRSSDVRTAIAAGDLGTATRLLGRPHTVVGLAKVAPDGIAVRFPLPVALPPDGEYDVRLETGGRRTEGIGRVEQGSLLLTDVPPGSRVRVAFTGPGPIPAGTDEPGTADAEVIEPGDGDMDGHLPAGDTGPVDAGPISRD
jgi:riboflavin kinase/FMN adenylyltransferase